MPATLARESELTLLRVIHAYPLLTDDEFVTAHLDAWLGA